MWVLININSSQGEHEFTMDEVEIIQNYLLTQAGVDTDVILGMGYDSTLGDKIGITLIATGFEHKDPFAKPIPKKEEPKPEEKIVMILGQTEETPVIPINQKVEIQQALLEKEMEATKSSLELTKKEDYLMPKLVEEFPVAAPVIDLSDIKEEEPVVIHWELQSEEKLLSKITEETISISTVSKIQSSD